MNDTSKDTSPLTPGAVAARRCFNHHDREAAAICLECSRTFCRECVTEHDDRVICASCLRSIGEQQQSTRRPLRLAALLLQSIAGFLIVWFFFFALGQLLLQMPSEFHDGSTTVDDATP